MKTLTDYLNVNSGLRNAQWENDFLRSFVSSNVYIEDDSVQIGPDGWPYLYLTDSKEQKHVSEDKSLNLLQWAYDHGVGLVLNASKERPDYVFNFGMIWNFIHNKTFLTETFENNKSNAPIYVAKVSGDIIPQKPLEFIKDYIKSAGVEAPRCALITRDKVNYDFAVGLESIGNPPKSEHEGIAKGLSWFLPHHIPVVLIYEDKLQKLFEI
jgi:hypothetical protein